MIIKTQECIIINLNKSEQNKCFNSNVEKRLFNIMYTLYQKAEKRNIFPIPIYIENDYFYAHDKRFYIRFKINNNKKIKGYFFINKVSSDKYILEKTKNIFTSEYPSLVRDKNDLKYITKFYFSKKLFKSNIITILREIAIDVEYLQLIPVLGYQYDFFKNGNNLIFFCKEYDLYITIMSFNYSETL